MPEVTKHAPGSFCWVELATTDPAAAKRFYGDLFDWSAEDMPAGEGMTYTMLRLRGKDVGAMYRLEEERQKQGIPPHWFTYVAVTNADEMAKKAAGLGATVVAEPFDVMDVGRMAVLCDPTGAHFALWQGKRHIGTGVTDEPAAHTWTELLTNDTKKAGDFYTGLFGWKRKEDMGGYTVFTNGEAMAGGMMAITKEMGPIPPNWMVYFAVRDADATAERVKKLGGEVLKPPTDIPEIGRFAVVQDPQGAAFCFIKLHQPA